MWARLRGIFNKYLIGDIQTGIFWRGCFDRDIVSRNRRTHTWFDKKLYFDTS